MTSQIKEIPSLQVSLCSMIRAFFETLNDDQVLHLLSETMDDTTRLLLLQLISNIINHLSSAVQTRVTEMNAEVTEELVVSSLGNAVTESLKAALGAKTRGPSRSAKTLRDMMSQEVMVSVQCSMSDTPKEHVTDPERLDVILELVIRIITVIVRKMSTPPTREPATSPPTGCRARVDNTDNISDEDQDVVSITVVQNCCTYKMSCSLDDISDHRVESESFLHGQYESNESVVSSAGESSAQCSSMEYVFPSVSSEKVAVASPEDLCQEIRKSSVFLMVERLVSLAHSRNRVTHSSTDPTSLIERLMARTWAAVKDVEFSPKTYANLEKTIFKDLVKLWGCESLVLIHMRVGSPALEELVANAIKARLTAPEKQSCIRRFFTSVGRVMGFGRV